MSPRKLISFLILVSFFLTSVYPSQTSFANPAPLPKSEQSLVESHRIFDLKSFPRDLGEIKASWKGSSDRVVVFIEDAHSVSDAQKNIHALIEYFETKFNFSLVGVEGASHPLDVQLFKSFPDAQVREDVFQAYGKAGELTGVSAAAIFGKKSVHYEGLEDWALYVDGVSRYLQAKEKSLELNPRLEKWKEQLDQKKREVYSPQLLELDRALQKVNTDNSDFLEAFQKMIQIKKPKSGTLLAALMKELEEDPDQNLWLQKEIEDLTRRLENLKLTPDEKKQFNQERQSYSIGQITPQTFASSLVRLIEKKLPEVKIPRKLHDLVRSEISLRNVHGSLFYDEYQRFVQEVKETLFINQQERKLDQESHTYDLAKRLSRLELSRDEWKEASLQKEALIERLGAREHFDFYDNVEHREDALYQNLIKKMKSFNQDRAIAVAGGFHTQGMMGKLQKEGISYLVVSPRMEELPEASLYENQMKGKFSWSSYFQVENGQIDLYQAFVRAARDRLLNSSAKVVHLTVLKDWRDQILRDLAQQGRISEAEKYTQYLDELTGNKNKNALKREWLANSNEFLDELKKLYEKGDSTPQNILNLITPSMVVTLQQASTSPGSAFRPINLPEVNVPQSDNRSETRSVESLETTAVEDLLRLFGLEEYRVAPQAKPQTHVGRFRWLFPWSKPAPPDLMDVQIIEVEFPKEKFQQTYAETGSPKGLGLLRQELGDFERAKLVYRGGRLISVTPIPVVGKFIDKYLDLSRYYFQIPPIPNPDDPVQLLEVRKAWVDYAEQWDGDQRVITDAHKYREAYSAMALPKISAPKFVLVELDDHKVRVVAFDLIHLSQMLDPIFGHQLLSKGRSFSRKIFQVFPTVYIPGIHASDDDDYYSKLRRETESFYRDSSKVKKEKFKLLVLGVGSGIEPWIIQQTWKRLQRRSKEIGEKVLGDLDIHTTDINPLAVASATRLQQSSGIKKPALLRDNLDRLNLEVGDFPDRFDLIVWNMPYVYPTATSPVHTNMRDYVPVSVLTNFAKVIPYRLALDNEAARVIAWNIPSREIKTFDIVEAEFQRFGLDTKNSDNQGRSVEGSNPATYIVELTPELREEQLALSHEEWQRRVDELAKRLDEERNGVEPFEGTVNALEGVIRSESRGTTGDQPHGRSETSHWQQVRGFLWFLAGIFHLQNPILYLQHLYQSYQAKRIAKRELKTQSLLRATESRLNQIRQQTDEWHWFFINASEDDRRAAFGNYETWKIYLHDELGLKEQVLETAKKYASKSQLDQIDALLREIQILLLRINSASSVKADEDALGTGSEDAAQQFLGIYGETFSALLRSWWRGQNWFHEFKDPSRPQNALITFLLFSSFLYSYPNVIPILTPYAGWIALIALHQFLSHKMAHYSVTFPAFKVNPATKISDFSEADQFRMRRIGFFSDLAYGFFPGIVAAMLYASGRNLATAFFLALVSVINFLSIFFGESYRELKKIPEKPGRPEGPPIEAPSSDSPHSPRSESRSRKIDKKAAHQKTTKPTSRHSPPTAHELAEKALLDVWVPASQYPDWLKKSMRLMLKHSQKLYEAQSGFYEIFQNLSEAFLSQYAYELSNPPNLKESIESVLEQGISLSILKSLGNAITDWDLLLDGELKKIKGVREEMNSDMGKRFSTKIRPAKNYTQSYSDHFLGMKKYGNAAYLFLMLRMFEWEKDGVPDTFLGKSLPTELKKKLPKFERGSQLSEKDLFAKVVSETESWIKHVVLSNNKYEVADDVMREVSNIVARRVYPQLSIYFFTPEHDQKRLEHIRGELKAMGEPEPESKAVEDYLRELRAIVNRAYADQGDEREAILTKGLLLIDEAKDFLNRYPDLNADYQHLLDDAALLKAAERHKYYAGYKVRNTTVYIPNGLGDSVTQFDDLTPIGARLGHGAEGLGLVTDDVSFSVLMFPDVKVKRLYRIELNDVLEAADLSKMESGFVFTVPKIGRKPISYRSGPAVARKIETDGKTYSIIELETTEAQYGRIAQMMQELGYEHVHVQPIGVGEVYLADLKVQKGQVRELRGRELLKLLKIKSEANDQLAHLGITNSFLLTRRYFSLLRIVGWGNPKELNEFGKSEITKLAHSDNPDVRKDVLRSLLDSARWEGGSTSEDVTKVLLRILTSLSDDQKIIDEKGNEISLKEQILKELFDVGESILFYSSEVYDELKDRYLNDWDTLKSGFKDKEGRSHLLGVPAAVDLLFYYFKELKAQSQAAEKAMFADDETGEAPDSPRSETRGENWKRKIKNIGKLTKEYEKDLDQIYSIFDRVLDRLDLERPPQKHWKIIDVRRKIKEKIRGLNDVRELKEIRAIIKGVQVRNIEQLTELENALWSLLVNDLIGESSRLELIHVKSRVIKIAAEIIDHIDYRLGHGSVPATQQKPEVLVQRTEGMMFVTLKTEPKQKFKVDSFSSFRDALADYLGGAKHVQQHSISILFWPRVTKRLGDWFDHRKYRPLIVLIPQFIISFFAAERWQEILKNLPVFLIRHTEPLLRFRLFRREFSLPRYSVIAFNSFPQKIAETVQAALPVNSPVSRSESRVDEPVAQLTEERTVGITLGEPIVEVLRKNDIDPTDFTTVVYPTAGNHDANLLLFLKTIFPKIQEYHLDDLAYATGYTHPGEPSAGEKLAAFIRSKWPELETPPSVLIYDHNFLQTKPSDVQESDLESGKAIHSDGQFRFVEDGKRIFIDKGPGRNAKLRLEPTIQMSDGTNIPVWYVIPLKQRILRPGDLVITFPFVNTRQFMPWAHQLASQVEFPESWLRNRNLNSPDIYEITEADIKLAANISDATLQRAVKDYENRNSRSPRSESRKPAPEIPSETEKNIQFAAAVNRFLHQNYGDDQEPSFEALEVVYTLWHLYNFFRGNSALISLQDLRNLDFSSVILDDLDEYRDDYPTDRSLAKLFSIKFKLNRGKKTLQHIDFVQFVRKQNIVVESQGTVKLAKDFQQLVQERINENVIQLVYGRESLKKGFAIANLEILSLFGFSVRVAITLKVAIPGETDDIGNLLLQINIYWHTSSSIYKTIQDGSWIDKSTGIDYDVQSRVHNALSDLGSLTVIPADEQEGYNKLEYFIRDYLRDSASRLRDIDQLLAEADQFIRRVARTQKLDNDVRRKVAKRELVRIAIEAKEKWNEKGPVSVKKIDALKYQIQAQQLYFWFFSNPDEWNLKRAEEFIDQHLPLISKPRSELREARQEVISEASEFQKLATRAAIVNRPESISPDQLGLEGQMPSREEVAQEWAEFLEDAQLENADWLQISEAVEKSIDDLLTRVESIENLVATDLKPLKSLLRDLKRTTADFQKELAGEELEIAMQLDQGRPHGFSNVPEDVLALVLSEFGMLRNLHFVTQGQLPKALVSLRQEKRIQLLRRANQIRTFDANEVLALLGEADRNLNKSILPLLFKGDVSKLDPLTAEAFLRLAILVGLLINYGNNAELLKQNPNEFFAKYKQLAQWLLASSAFSFTSDADGRSALTFDLQLLQQALISDSISSAA